MTVLLVLILIVAFVGTDQVIRAASLRAKARREGAPGGVAKTGLTSGVSRLGESHGSLHP